MKKIHRKIMQCQARLADKWISEIRPMETDYGKRSFTREVTAKILKSYGGRQPYQLVAAMRSKTAGKKARCARNIMRHDSNRFFDTHEIYGNFYDVKIILLKDLNLATPVPQYTYD